MHVRSALVLLVSILAAAPLSTGGSGSAAPPFVPAVAEGYVLAPLVALPAPTAIVFGPGDADGPDLYATTLSGDVLRVALSWTPAGPVATGVSVHARGFQQPLGLEFDADGALYVADSVEGDESNRVDGRLTRVAPEGVRTVVVSGIPNGRHNLNNLRWGPEGRLYMANGNPNDSGPQTGFADVFPYSGAILSVDAAQVTASPAVLRWRDASGAAIPAEEIASHPLNADFAAKVHVLGHGFRNVYDVTFAPDGSAYTATNGADDPASQDLLYKITPGADHGFPFCYNVGTPGDVGEDVSVAPNPVYGDAARCAGVPRASALLGWHVCTTGLDVAAEGAFGHAVYVGECATFFAHSWLAEVSGQPGVATHSTAHKVVRVALDGNGEAAEVRDFITGLALPLDVHFGPDGALYVADVEMVYRVSPLLPETAGAGVVPARIVAAPGATFTGYATSNVPLLEGSPASFLNRDVLSHDVTASDYGDDDQPWCPAYPEGRCPLFKSAVTGSGGESPVQGVERLEGGKGYGFFCSIHPGMRGTITTLSPP